MTVQDVLKKWLKDNGYDGLVSVGAECGCEISDLIPCGECCDTCWPAYRGPDPSGECKWRMYGGKEAADAARKAEDAAREKD